MSPRHRVSRHRFAISLLILAIVLPTMAVADSPPEDDYRAVIPLVTHKGMCEQAFADHVLADTYAYFAPGVGTVNGWPRSWYIAEDQHGDHANPAEIGLYMVVLLGALDAGLEDGAQATWDNIARIVHQLDAWQCEPSDAGDDPNAYLGSVFYQWYWVSWNPPVVGDHDPSKPEDTNQNVPSIDNAWLAASLIVVREYAEANGQDAIAQTAEEVLDRMDFMLWYNEETRLFMLGDYQEPMAGDPADYYSNENRIINHVAHSLGQLSDEEYLLSLAALDQQPKGYASVSAGTTITVSKVAWDGSSFTYTSPALFYREMATSYGHDTINPAMWAQIAYAEDQGYDASGISDCYSKTMTCENCTDGNFYLETGAPPADTTHPLEPIPGWVTPHASGLAAITGYRCRALRNLIKIRNDYPGAYQPDMGFREAVMVNPEDVSPHVTYGDVSEGYTSLAQEWMFLGLLDYRTGFVWRWMYEDQDVRTTHALLERYLGDQVCSER